MDSIMRDIASAMASRPAAPSAARTGTAGGHRASKSKTHAGQGRDRGTAQGIWCDIDWCTN